MKTLAIHLFFLPLAAAVMLGFPSPAAGQGAPAFTVIQARNEAVPGAGVDPRIPADAQFKSYHEPAIDDAGQLAYYATWTSRAEGDGGGIFAGDALIAALGEAAPVAAPTVAGPFFKSFKDPVMSGDGRVAFIATLRGAGVGAANDTVVVTNAFDAGGALEIVARENSFAPDGTGANIGTWKSFENLSLQSHQGRHGLLFTAYLKTGAGPSPVTAASDFAAWLRSETLGPTPVVVVREGQPAPSLPGRFIKNFDLLRAANTLDSVGHGRGHFQADHVDVAVTLTSIQAPIRGLLRWRPGFVELWPVTGSLEPMDGERWEWVGQMSCGDNAGRSYGVALGALQVGPSLVTREQAERIFVVGEQGGLHRVMGGGSPAPRLPGVFLKSFKYPVASATNPTVLPPVGFPGGPTYQPLNFSVAAPGYLTGNGVTRANDFALFWARQSGELRILARAGDQPPGAPAGTRWTGAFSLALPGGTIGPIFTGKLAGTGVRTANDIALYAVDSFGGLREVLREGQPLLGGNVSTFHLLSALPGITGATRSFNNAGQIAVLVKFTDRKSALVRIDVP